MANLVFNIAKGKVAEKVADGATIKMLILKSAGADATLLDFNTVAAVIAEGSTVEADFTNYERKTLASLTAAANDTDDKMYVDAADVVYTTAGGASNNTTTDVLIYEDVDTTDANAIPLVLIDCVFTTDGNDVTLQFHANGWFEAA